MSSIIAIVTLQENKVRGGGAPTFYVEKQEDLQHTAFTLEKILDATAHDLKNGVMILVDHKNSGKH
jgi:hypothetical protein